MHQYFWGRPHFSELPRLFQCVERFENPRLLLFKGQSRLWPPLCPYVIVVGSHRELLVTGTPRHPACPVMGLVQGWALRTYSRVRAPASRPACYQLPALNPPPQHPLQSRLGTMCLASHMGDHLGPKWKETQVGDLSSYRLLFCFVLRSL